MPPTHPEPSLSSSTITLPTFHRLLSHYTPLLASLSATKKPDSSAPAHLQTLAQLDTHRHSTLPSLVATRSPPYLTKAEVESLVRWKLSVSSSCLHAADWR